MKTFQDFMLECYSIQETSLNRIKSKSDKGGMAILSAQRGDKSKKENKARIYAILPDLVKARRIKKLMTINIVFAINNFLEYSLVYKNIKIVLINKCTDLSPFLYKIILWSPKILIGGKYRNTK